MTRDERRWHRSRVMARRRKIICLWYSAATRPEDNLLWLRCAKNNFAHGCPLCHYEKYDRKSASKRRRALDAEIEFNLAAWSEQI